jgi:hypothetical protein
MFFAWINDRKKTFGIKNQEENIYGPDENRKGTMNMEANSRRFGIGECDYFKSFTALSKGPTEK